MTSYRPEIDGLRAIAVLAVVLYHADLLVFGNDLFSGGFIGVDIFFVLSGYLIASNLLRDLAGDDFSFRRFYTRRIRRILPPLFFVTAISTIFAWRYLFPKQFLEYAQSLISSTLFTSNFYFWRQDVYTAEPNALQPLIHTWSLSVEEQYYALIPIALLLVWRFARRFLTSVIIIGFLVSLQLADWGSKEHVGASFYLLPSRGWELLAGGLLANVELEFGRKSHPWLTAILPLVGIFLIVRSIGGFSDEMAHPGFQTLIPVVGVMLVIWFAGERDLVSWLLSTKAFVWVGLISYSLYLWHQPLFAFARVLSVNALSVPDKLGLIALSVALAGLTWFVIERPFRNAKQISFPVLVVALAVVGSALVGIGALGNATDGAPGRFSEAELSLMDYQPARGTTEDGSCRNRRPASAACIVGAVDTLPTWAVLGDSHVETLTAAIGDVLSARDEAGLLFIRTVCPVILGVRRAPGNITCDEYVREYIDALAPNNLKNVIINDRATAYITGKGYDNGEGGIEFLEEAVVRIDTLEGTDSEAKRLAAVTRLFSETMRDLLTSGLNVYYVLPIPEVGWDAPRVVIQQLQRRQLPVTTSLSRYKIRNEIIIEQVKALESHPNFHAIYPHEVLCSNVTWRCSIHGDGQIYYYDTDHLSVHGANLVVDEIARVIEATQ